MSKLEILPRGFYGLPIEAKFDPNDPVFVELETSVLYVDKYGKEYYVLAGYKTDGKSVPRAFWGIAGQPLAPNTLPAAVIHDKLCDEKTLPSKRVHQIFDEALQDLPKVSWLQRNTLVMAVKMFGPRF